MAGDKQPTAEQTEAARRIAHGGVQAGVLAAARFTRHRADEFERRARDLKASVGANSLLATELRVRAATLRSMADALDDAARGASDILRERVTATADEALTAGG